MVTKPSFRPFRWVRFSEDAIKDDVGVLASFYRNQGYLDAKVELTSLERDSGRKMVDITIEIQEGKATYVRRVEFEGYGVLKKSEIGKLVKTQKGKRLVSTRIDKDAGRIVRRYGEIGYLQAAVRSQVKLDSGRDSALVRFLIEENGVSIAGERTIKGLDDVKPKLVKRELKFSKGDTLTRPRISQSVEGLYRTGLFRTASVDPVLVDSSTGEPIEDSMKHVMVRLEEAKMLDIGVGIGYSTEEQARLTGDVTYRNLFGLGKRIAFDGKLSFLLQKARAVYTDPRFLSLPGKLDVTGYFTRDSTKAYTARFWGTTAHLSFTTRYDFGYSVGFRWEDVRYSADSLGDTASRPTQSISVQAVYDKRDNRYNPTSGFFLSARGEIAGLAGLAGIASGPTNQFYRLGGAARWYWPIGEALVGGASIELGYVREYRTELDVPPKERYYAGGANSIRGFKGQMVGPIEWEDDDWVPLGGNILVELHVLEIRFPIYKIVNGTVFLDAGNVFKSFDSFLDDGGLRWSAGVGLNVSSALGVIRLDVGFPLDRNTHLNDQSDEVPAWFHFDVGHAF